MERERSKQENAQTESTTVVNVHRDVMSAAGNQAVASLVQSVAMSPDEAKRILGVQLHATIGGGASRSDDVVQAMNSMHRRWFMTNEQYNRTYQVLGAQRLDPGNGNGQTIEDKLIPDFVAGLRTAKAAGPIEPAPAYKMDTKAEAHLAGAKDAEILAGERDLILTGRARQKALKGKADRSPAENDELARLNAFLGQERIDALARSAEARALQDIKTTPEEWFADIVKVTFLGRPVTVHKILAERLAEAEQALAGEQAPANGWISSSIGLRRPGSGLHGFGLAIDLNPATNPFIFNATSTEANAKATGQDSIVRGIIDRAVLLIEQKTAAEEKFEARPQLTGEATGARSQAAASWDKLEAASEALREYMALASPERREALDERVEALGDKDAKKRTAAQWATTIAKDRKDLQKIGPAKDWKGPDQGFLDLDRRLVLAMADAGLTWLGDDTIGGGRDIMHFDTRQLGPIKTLYSAAAGDKWTATALVKGH